MKIRLFSSLPWEEWGESLCSRLGQTLLSTWPLCLYFYNILCSKTLPLALFFFFLGFLQSFCRMFPAIPFGEIRFVHVFWDSVFCPFWSVLLSNLVHMNGLSYLLFIHASLGSIEIESLDLGVLYVLVLVLTLPFTLWPR